MSIVGDVGINFWFNTEMIVYSNERTKDAAGSWTDEPIPIQEAECRIRNKTGREREVDAELGKESSHRIYSDPLDVTLDPEKHFIKIGTRTYDIIFPNNPHEEDEFLQIDVMERD